MSPPTASVCAKRSHDKMGFHDWIAALGLTSEAQEKVKGLIQADEFDFNAQWELLKEVEDSKVTSLGLIATMDMTVRLALRRLGNENMHDVVQSVN